MNVIVLMLDSLRQDHVSFYGWDNCPVKTPNIDALAAEAAVFDNIYPEGMPTIPVRTDLMTGQSSLTNRFWQPMMATDVTASKIFRRAGYFTALVADTYHLFKPDMNFHRDFEAFRWIRGAEYDSVGTGVPKHLKFEDHVTPNTPRYWHQCIKKCLLNLDGRIEPEDFPCYQTVANTLEVLAQAREAKQKVFLWLDTFQNHEPWCPPKKFDTFGDPNYKGPRMVMPPGHWARDWGNDEITKRIRSLYTGEVAYVDWCMGLLFDGMRRMGYFDDSLIVLLSDHGHPLADHGKFLKSSDRMYNELLKVPFIVRLPGGKLGGRRITALGRFPDLLPTVLDYAGLGANAASMAGRSLRQVIDSGAPSPYEATVTGYFESVERSIRTERYHLFIRKEDEFDELYDIIADPHEQKNIIGENAKLAEELASKIGVAYMGNKTVPRGVQGKVEVAGTSLQ